MSSAEAMASILKRLEKEETEKFSCVVSNPPYHEESGGQKTHIWHRFVEVGNLLSNYSCFIHPSGWIKGGIRLLETKRDWQEKKNLQCVILHEDPVFSNVGIQETTITFFNNKIKIHEPKLFVVSSGSSSVVDLDLEAVKFYKTDYDEVVEKVISRIRPTNPSRSLQELVLPQRALGIEGKHFKQDISGRFSREKTDSFSTKVLVLERLLDARSKEAFYWIDISDKYWDARAPHLANKWKVAFSATGDKQWQNNWVLAPDEWLTDKFLFVCFDSEEKANNFQKYLSTNFYRFLMKPLLVDQNALRKTHRNVPDLEDYTDSNPHIDWSQPLGPQLYELFGLTEEEIAVVEGRVS